MIAKQLRKRGSNLELGPDNVKLLVSGLAFGRAIQAALGKNKLLDGLRINNKEGNWNALVPVLRRLSVRVDNDAKSLILSGEEDEIMDDIMKFPDEDPIDIKLDSKNPSKKNPSKNPPAP